MSESTAATATSSSTPTPTPLLQQIYDIVVKQSGTFQNDALTTISSHLSALTPDHVGLKLPDGLDQQLANLTTEMKSMQVKEKDKKEEKQKALAKVIHYQSVYLGMAFHMGIFLLPKGACIPLHDHPGMTVCTAVLYGSVHLRAYQWVHRPKQSKGRLHGPARLVVDEVVTAPSGAIVVKDDQFDADGKNIQIINSRTSSSSIIECPNIHRLIALTDTAIFDILLPPYSAFAKRPCHNYRMHRISKQSTYDAQPIDEKNVKNICEAARFRTSRSKSLHESQYHSSDESASDEEDPTTHTRKPHPLVYLHQCSEPQSQVIRPSRYMGTKIRLHDAQDRAQEGDSDDDHSVGVADEVMIMDDTDTSQSDVLEEGDEPEDDGRQ